jgi:hypothetical protein
MPRLEEKKPATAAPPKAEPHATNGLETYFLGPTIRSAPGQAMRVHYSGNQQSESIFRLMIQLYLSTHVRNYGDVFRQAAGARRLTAILAKYVTVFPNSCTKPAMIVP